MKAAGGIVGEVSNWKRFRARISKVHEEPFRMTSLSLELSEAEYDALVALLTSDPDWEIAQSLLPKLIDAGRSANHFALADRTSNVTFSGLPVGYE